MIPATILITGATDGIGLALARQYAAEGARLLLVGRKSLAQLDDHPDASLFTPTTYCQADLSQPDAPHALAAFLDSIGIERLDCVIHNAGAGYYGPPQSQPAESIRYLVDVNLKAPIALTQVLLPYVERASGRFVFISSVATALPVPDYAVYAATKAALEGFARSLRVELGSRVRVQVIRPGATRTGMHRKVGLPEKKTRRYPPAGKVAEQIRRAIARGRPVATIGVLNRLVTMVGPWLRGKGGGPTGTAQPTVAITGAADGIGRALALRYASAGWRVIGIDRDAARAGTLAAENPAISCQVHDLRRELDWVDELPPLDLFIHNAGISAVGRFEHVPLDAQHAVLDVNLVAPLSITARLLAGEKLSPDGALVYISSLSHFASYPGAATYAASKDGVAHYARSIGRIVPTLAVFPGPTRTRHARRYSPDNRREQRRMSPDALAEAIFQAQQRGARRLLPGAGTRILARLSQLAPRLVEMLMRRTLYAKLPPDPLI